MPVSEALGRRWKRGGRHGDATDRRRRRLVLYLVPLGLLVVTWAMTNPPWAGPDEAAQYVKALGTVSGDPVGHAALWQEPEAPQTAAQRSYFAVTSRRFAVPSRLAPRIPTIPCFAYHPAVSAACATTEGSGPVQDISYVGAYPPPYFVLPGLAAHLGGSPANGLRAARLIGAGEFLVLVGGALVLLDRRGTGPPPIGVLLALTPMTLSLGGAVSSSSFEAAAAVLFMAACVRLVEQPPGRALAVVVVGAGTLLAWSRQLGPLWVAGALVVAGILAGRHVVACRLRDRTVQIAAAALVVLTASSLIWDLALGFGSGVARSSLVTAVHHLVTSAPTLFREEVGVFGFLDSALPTSVYVACAVLAIALLVGALLVGRGRQRGAIIGGVAFYALVVVAVFVTTATTGFPLQGRYFLAPWAFVAIIVGETLNGAALRRRGGSGLRWPSAIGILAFAGINLGALYVNARRYAVGVGHPWLFFTHPAWSPPGGWYLWLAVSFLAGVGLVLAACLELLPDRRAQPKRTLADRTLP